MKKHTAGPWRIGKPSVMNGVQIFHDTFRNAEPICIMPEKGRERTANARLIAAAPEMYEAVKQMRDMLLDHDVDMTEIDALLSKIEGETP